MVIGLDAFDPLELERKLAEGSLPNIAQDHRARAADAPGARRAGLRRQHLEKLLNGLPVGEHGWYFVKVWDPHTGRLERASPDFLRLKSFWPDLARTGLRIGLVDVPYTPDPGEGFNGVYLSGWQTHDVHVPCSRPEGLLAAAGAALRPSGASGRALRQAALAGLVNVRNGVIASIGQIAGICEWLLRDPFDVFAVVLGATHRGGHYVWDLSQVEGHERTGPDARLVERAMDDIYEACDSAVGRIAAAMPAARICLFSLHGMGPNPGWNEAFPEVIDAMHAGARPRAPTACDPGCMPPGAIRWR